MSENIKPLLLNVAKRFVLSGLLINPVTDLGVSTPLDASPLKSADPPTR
ncbi:hypothetical protein [Nostoc sp.]